MDSIEELKQNILALTVVKCLLVTGIVLTLYDHLLMLDDEVQYIWRGRKTWIFYLYTLNRALLTVLRLRETYATIAPRDSQTGCTASYYLEVLFSLFFLSSSDIFITLRIYAITFKNKILIVYFGILAVARFAVGLASFLQPATFLDLPPIPIEAFNLCPTVAHPRFKLVPVSIATVFELSAFLVVAWCAYRINVHALKLSAVIRTIVAEASVYFFVMVVLQIYIQLSFVFMETVIQQVSFSVYTMVNPLLTMRFAISLKRSADSGRELKSAQLSSVKFMSGSSSSSQVPPICEDFEMGPVHPLSPQRQNSKR